MQNGVQRGVEGIAKQNSQSARLPSSAAEEWATQMLAARIRRDILHLAPGRIEELRVELTASHTIVLTGRCSSYYCKQLAQHAAMQLAPGEQIENQIRVE